MAVESAAEAAIAQRLWTVDEYYRMAETGILKPDERVELIEGVVVAIPPIGPEHAGSVDRLGDLMRSLLGSTVIVRGQNPVHLKEGSEPEPDLAVVRRRDNYYRDSHPTAMDTLLIIEIADSSLAYDRLVKGKLYAEAGIQDYWIANLVDDQIEVHRDPSPDGYRSVRIARRGDTIQPVAFPDMMLTVADILG
jgi:Uma2 family endonuclease